MDNTEVLAIINFHRRNSLGYDDTEVSNERAEAFDHYHGRPYGNEQEGRSQVVTRDLSETIDWVMPSLMKIFTSSDAAEFTPVGPGDEQQAEQETEYVNYVIRVDNNQFMFTHDWFKDALLLKNGYIKHWWMEEEKIVEDEYDDLTDDQLTMLISDIEDEAKQEKGSEVKIVAQRERPLTTPDGQPIVGQDGQPMSVWDVKLRTKMKTGKLRIEAVPTEEIRVSKRCRGSLQESPFTEHVTLKTRTELIEMGMDPDFVKELPAYQQVDRNDEVVYSRNSTSNETNEEHHVTMDSSMDDIEYCEAYVMIDFDGDGKAELRKIITAGNRIPPGDEWNEPIDSVPLTSISPKRVPHRHIGESLDDELADLQEIHTTLMRQMLDNIYRTNNQEIVVNERANLPDFMVSLPGGVKRLEGDEPVAGHFQALQYTPILQQILPAIDHIDSMKQFRTGVNDLNTNIPADVLKDTNNPVMIEGLSKASQKIEMIARFFAEGMKELMIRVHEILIKHQDRERVVKLRNGWVPINPQQWKTRSDMKIKVGLGTGSETEKRAKYMMFSSLIQQVGEAFGIVDAKRGFNLVSDIGKTLDIHNPERYMMDPESDEYKQMMQQKQQQEASQSNMLADAERVRGEANMQIEQMKAQSTSQIEMLKQQFDAQKSQMQNDFNAQVKALETQLKAQFELAKTENDNQNKELDRKSKEAIEILKAEVDLIKNSTPMDIGQPGLGTEMNEQ